MRITIAILFTAIFASSCEKNPDNLTLLIKESGSVSVKILDDGGKVVDGAHVQIFSSIPENQMIYSDSTNSSGICMIGNVLQGQYRYLVKAIKGNRKYYLSDHFQVISGSDKVCEAFPFRNTGDVSVTIINQNSLPLAGVNVGLIPRLRVYDPAIIYTFRELLNDSYAVIQTDTGGKALFRKMPAGSGYNIMTSDEPDYSVFIFRDSLHYDYPFGNNYLDIYRGAETRNFIITTNL